jgi:hypothetical protein
MARSDSIAAASDNDWRTESDLNTLLEAKKIEADKKRMDKVRALAKQKMLDVASVAADEDYPGRFFFAYR